LNDPRKFKAPYIPKERIWPEADRLRSGFPAGRELPVRVLDLAEFDLRLDIVPVNGLREELDIDALLMGDLKSILVDKRAFMSPRLEYRLRFSVAHEIGHLILHRDIYAGVQHATAVEWFDYISAIPEVEYGWVEWQAYEFAGRLLVPPEPLREAFQSAIKTAEAAGYSDWLAADETALDYIATRIAPKFGVSAEVIAKRLRVERFWPPN
jgi:IrrE N-terminal-like domain